MSVTEPRPATPAGRPERWRRAPALRSTAGIVLALASIWAALDFTAQQTTQRVLVHSVATASQSEAQSLRNNMLARLQLLAADMASLIRSDAWAGWLARRTSTAAPDGRRALYPDWLTWQVAHWGLAVDAVMVRDTAGNLLAAYEREPARLRDLDLDVTAANTADRGATTDIDFVDRAGGTYLLARRPWSGGDLLVALRADGDALARLTGAAPGWLRTAVVRPDDDSSPPDLTLLLSQMVALPGSRTGRELRVWFDPAGLAALQGSLTGAERVERTAWLTLCLFAVLALVRARRKHRTELNAWVDTCADRLGVQRPPRHADSADGGTLERLARLGDELLAETRALEYQARHDALSGLPNRMLLLERVNEELARRPAGTAGPALLVMDLNRFKDVNDTLGHHVGDRLLKEVGRRLVGVLRATDTVARLGGDEFAVLLPEADRDQVRSLCRKIVAALDTPIRVEDTPLQTGISIGVALCPEHGHDADTLMRRADVAMYVAKKEHRGFAVYSETKDNHCAHRLGLAGELRTAIGSDELYLEYQPLIDVGSGAVVCVEALLRWNHPQLGRVPPDEFVPVAEQNGVIQHLTLWVIDRALAQVADWQRMGIELRMSINLSMRCLQDRLLPTQVQRYVDKHRVSPTRVTLEVTESAIMADPITVRRVLRRLSNMGFHIAIDDFGTGYSSLAYLQQLPVDEIKIDKSFVARMHENEGDAVIVRTTVDLAHNLGLRVVAEGVENRAVWGRIRKLACDSAQGYYLREPMSAVELVRWVRAGGREPEAADARDNVVA